MNSGFPPIVLLFTIFLSCFSGILSAAEVTLQSIQIHQTHEWLRQRPTIYFHCKGENKTFLPDVKKANTLYTFKGEESWQPLTEFVSKKCKRCGLYEKDILTDDRFDEWEFCPSDFTAPDGTYNRAKEGEFNASFACSTCVDVGADHAAPHSDTRGNGKTVAVAVVISVFLTTALIIVFIGGYKYWQKRKRRQEQARFLKLFEEQDDIEDELGLRDII
ncbi:hypothetical protein BVRB_7g162490 [Beta vulgaris subsp. vulgaris]|uniref:uncharacterized protein LOC104898768 n=1 Tax=Beta vulgaris subsp. vulgaris TaxID=3555 RepID=UPI00053FC969|nr:uncharacterized protein LOC104898768 [Beta vulgaris subsp. vulgaris]KMT06176.1 hypothetical protein BVRB_7g162490 [Beta vulgaris subsp. vulgaris]